MRMVLGRVVSLGLISGVLYILLHTGAGLVGENFDDRVAMGIAVWAALVILVLVP